MRIYLSFLVFFVLYSFSPAQNISAFLDYKNYFYVFDNGISKELEYLPVQWYKVGKNAVVYLNNSGDFKAYYNGDKYDLADAQPSDCRAADDFIVYFSNRILNIFDRGKIMVFSGWTSNYITGDSIVGCFDEQTYTYKIYYHGQTSVLADVLDGNSIKSFKAGDNILAYVNNEGFLKIYYNNQVFNTEITQAKYKAAANTVAFVNDATQEFKVFYKGSVMPLSNFPPRSFLVADDLVAYIDNNESFKVFYQGKIMDLTSFVPQFYKAEDNILVYGDDANFKIFYKGVSYSIERYIPETYKMDFNTLVYVDSEGYLSAFFDGKTQRVCNEKIAVWELSGNVVKYTNSMNEVHFFLNGNTF
ncbi:MAG: hypothetical protein ACHQHP_03810 [Bacteroidia bacterium]